jgi:hypothetical protein
MTETRPVEITLGRYLRRNIGALPTPTAIPTS